MSIIYKKNTEQWSLFIVEHALGTHDPLLWEQVIFARVGGVLYGRANRQPDLPVRTNL